MLVIVNNHFNPLFGGIIDGWKFPLRKKLFPLKAKFSLPKGKVCLLFFPLSGEFTKKGGIEGFRLPPYKSSIACCKVGRVNS